MNKIDELIRGVPDTRADAEDYALSIVPQAAELDTLSLRQLCRTLRRTGMTAADVRDFRADIKGYLKEAQSFFTNASADDGGADPNSSRPKSWPYDIKGGRIVFMQSHMTQEGWEEFTEKPIADFSATISSEATNPDTGEKKYVVCGKSIRGGKFCLDISAKDFDKDRELKSLLGAEAGATAPIYYGMGGHLAPAVKLLSDETKIKRTIYYDRVGWTSNRRTFLIPGNEPPDTSINLHSQLPFAFDEDADLEKGLKGLRLLLDFNPTKTAPILAGIFLAPLLRPAELLNDRCICFIVGMTNSFKTVFTKAAMSIYGSGFQHDQNLMKWGEGATRTSIIGLAGMAADMPLFVDNYKPNTGGGAKAFVNLAHNIIEGGERLRSRTDGTVRENKPLYCIPIFNGEDVPKTDAASLARLVAVRFDAQKSGDADEIKVISALYKNHVNHLNAVGKAWITWLETDEGRMCAEGAKEIFERKRTDWRAYLDLNFPESQIKARIASNLAVLETSWSILLEHPAICDIADEYYPYLLSGLGEAAQYLIEGTNESIEAVRFVEALKELVASNRVLMSESRNSFSLMPSSDPSSARVIGWYEGDGSACILPRMAVQAVDRFAGDDLNGVTLNTLSQQLEEKGMIMRTSKGRGRHWIVNVVGKPQQRVLNLRPGVLRDMGRDGNADSADSVDSIVNQIPV